MNAKTNIRIHFQLLSDSDLQAIHGATMEVLNRTGVDIYDDEAQSLLKKAGASVDGSRVRIPSHLIEGAIKTVPKKIVIYDRNGDPALHLGSGSTYMSVGQGPPYMIDLLLVREERY